LQVDDGSFKQPKIAAPNKKVEQVNHLRHEKRSVTAFSMALIHHWGSNSSILVK
jgi:hypothetical protein